MKTNRLVTFFALVLANLVSLNILGDELLDDRTVVATEQIVGIHPLNGPVDNEQVYDTFLNNGLRLLDAGDRVGLEKLQKLARLAPRTSEVSRPAVLESTLSTYEQMVRSSVMIGTIYDCGHCNIMHANIAGGVIVDPTGLILTNYHVIDREESGVKALFVMTYDGQAYPIAEVLAASSASDVALLRIDAKAPLSAVAIATTPPAPLDKVSVLSHPQGQYYVLTQGVVSRYTLLGNLGEKTDWMEVTAEFTAGSSGSGVFNADGELVGLVSMVFPLTRTHDDDSVLADGSSSDGKYVEMILRRVVPHSQINRCFAELKNAQN